MKNFRLLFIMMAAVMFAVSCTEEEASVDDLSAKKAIAISEGDWGSIEFCGPVRNHDLIGGQTILMGSVAVGNDGTNLYVKYQADPGYVITETHLFVGDVDNMPTAGKNGNPKIGHFPYKWENKEGSEVVMHTIPLSEISGDCFDVVAHAVVECEDGTCEETAFGAGRNESGELVLAAKAWFNLDSGRSTFSYSSGTLFTEGCGYQTGFGYITIDLDNLQTEPYYFMGNLGTISLSIVDNNLVFVIEGEPGATLDLSKTVNLFVGDLNELYGYLSLAGCADYNSFPYNSNLSTTIIPLSEIESVIVEDAPELNSSRWGFYFNYCVSDCD